MNLKPLPHDNLEAFSDPINYDLEDSSDTGVSFYSKLAKEVSGSILEIACGTGRVTIPLAKLGYPVTGLDIVPGMLKQAQQKSEGLLIRYIEADARNFALNEVFDFIFMTGNAFQAFVTNTDQRSVLQRVHQHLATNGVFAFETRNPRFPGIETRAGLFPILETTLLEEPQPSFVNADGFEVSESLIQEYDHTSQILHLTRFSRWSDGHRNHVKTTRTALRYTFPQELVALLNYNGFEVDGIFGDWNYEPLLQNSPSIIVVCRKGEL
ncbi:MAG: class I SAM-dependent methyltransferase [Candidatus Cloacimonetes bacterium]|nr:class I SAM-dependent methyltransferase [Candidatus Cloacimonadota bacterium]